MNLGRLIHPSGVFPPAVLEGNLVDKHHATFMVHIVVRRANRYIVAFYITISYDIYLLTYSLSEVPPMDKQCRLATIISTMVICRLKYPE